MWVSPEFPITWVSFSVTSHVSNKGHQENLSIFIYVPKHRKKKLCRWKPLNTAWLAKYYWLSPLEGQEFYLLFPIFVQRFKHQIILLINFFLLQGNWGVPLIRSVFYAKHCRNRKKECISCHKGVEPTGKWAKIWDTQWNKQQQYF